MSLVLNQMRGRALLNLALSMLIVFLAFRLFGKGACFVLPLIVGIGLYMAAQSLMRIVRISQTQHDHMRQFQEALRGRFERADLPRHVFVLLLSVAKADGAVSDKERRLVREFVLQRFAQPIDIEDIAEWETTHVPPEQAGNIAATLRRVLSDSECETVFTWCCLVAFVDGSFQPEEHVVLQAVARQFGIQGHHARRLFHHAKQMHTQGGAGAHSRGHRESGSDAGQRAAGRVRSRQDALAILGLDDDADEASVRARHRELVKKYHPDRHVHLGPVAAAEAEERFREVQSAYEVLTG